MKNSKYFTLSLVVVAVVALTGVTLASAAFPGRGQGMGDKPNFDPANMTEEMQQHLADREAHRAEMKQARDEMQALIDSGDYDSWRAAIEKRQAERFNILDVINSDNFDKFVEMHNLMKAGDREGAQAIAEELGMPAGKGGMMMGEMGRGMHRGMMKGFGWANQTEEN